MASTHILTRSGSNLFVVLHIPIPSSNNAAGTNWQVAVVNSGLFGRPPGSVLPTGNGLGQISAAELASLANGSLIEVQDVYSPSAAEIAQANAYLDAMYTARSAQHLLRFQDMLQYFGYQR